MFLNHPSCPQVAAAVTYSSTRSSSSSSSSGGDQYIPITVGQLPSLLEQLGVDNLNVRYAPMTLRARPDPKNGNMYCYTSVQHYNNAVELQLDMDGGADFRRHVREMQRQAESTVSMGHLLFG